MLRAIGIVLAISLLSFPARGQSVEEFYKGKLLRLVVGIATGTDQDAWARLVARHMPRYIPGNPTIVVVNMPGSGGLTATNYLFNVAPGDGSVIGLISRSMPGAAIVKMPGVRFNPLEFKWLGSPETSNYALFINSSAPVKVPEDLYKQEVIVGATGDAQGITAAPRLLKNLLGMKIRIVQGYKSVGDMAVAAERGEIEAFVNTVGGPAGDRRPWVQSGQMRVLFNFAPARIRGIDVPTVFELAKSDKERDVLSFFAGNILLGRPFVAPPAVPVDRVDALRRAFDAVLKDPALLKEAQDIQFEIMPQTGEEATAIVARMVATPPEIVDAAERAVGTQ